MTLENVAYVQLVLGAVVNHEIAVGVGGDARGGVVVHDGVEDYGLFGGWVGDDVGHGGGVLVEEAVDVGSHGG